jgi:DNA-binding transcriptional LysR family regulator
MLTFVTLIHKEGDAAGAAEELGINQPSMSKRLAFLQHSGRILKRPWLERQGKQWRATSEGRRVLPAVEELLRRYEQLTTFVEAAAHPGLAVACGQEALTGILLPAVQRFRREHPEIRVRLATPRGEKRIEGVANGLFDLALVADDADRVRVTARRPLVVEELLDDPLVLAYPENSPWAEVFEKLPEKNVSGRMLVGLPLVLQEHDAAIREQFETKCREAGVWRQIEVAAEVSGWRAVLACVEAGLGTGLLPRSLAARNTRLMVRTLQASLTPPNRVRLIARTQPGTEEVDLTESALEFRDVLKASAIAFQETAGKGGKGR